MNEDAFFKRIDNLEMDIYDCNRYVKISIIVIIIGLISFLGNILGFFHESEIFQGLAIGSCFVTYINFKNKKARCILELNEMCLSRYGKSYDSSLSELIKEKAEISRKSIFG
ncbi:TPA: hypothetical protein I8271_005561 [Kluyvera intermedia]|uniref:SMODS and SLOG-associating 2TM effector domain-containing protein n=2 Tax=Enterobacteriaceae TaxID=543 RepID=A0AAC8QR31_9ENTR|nr:hypothetical protein [Phytobacter ursingii]HAT2208029.1 hypothetical protein [Kluyvera intermedia]AKL13251.1 hypothetical protein AB182_18975 [Phytobacter ursingii]HAT2518745.1 hypothetical protein [Kluyvera intermedia]HAT2606841.1 hypothetical protein [Kluyvera intermedia]HAT2683558.1 hypothetical protein [Kluyvera intermedia]